MLQTGLMKYSSMFRVDAGDFAAGFFSSRKLEIISARMLMATSSGSLAFIFNPAGVFTRANCVTGTPCFFKVL